VVPYDTAAISADPEVVRAPYSNLAALYYPDAKDPYTTDLLVEIFGKRKYIYSVNNWFEYFHTGQSGSYRFADAAIWPEMV